MLPKRLQLAGRARQEEAIEYFENNAKSKALISGWIKPADSNSQKLDFETFRQQLVSERKMGVVKPYESDPGVITIYIFAHETCKKFS